MSVFDKRSAARSDKFAGVFWRLFSKDHEGGPIKTTLEQLTDRVASLGPPAPTQEEIHCPACRVGILRLIGDPPSSLTFYGHGAFQKLPPEPGSLKCSHCGHIQQKDHPSSPADTALSEGELDRVMGGVMSTRLRRAIRRR